MSESGDATPPAPTRRDSTLWLALLGVGVAALIVAVIFWVAQGDDEPSDMSADTTTPTSVEPTTSVDEPTSTGVATTSSTTEPDTTTSSTTTTVSTVAPTVPTTAPRPTEPGGPTWVVVSPSLPDGEITMTRVDQADGLSVYDGATGDGIRCVAIVPDGSTGWHEWCGPDEQATRFVDVREGHPWLVDVGRPPGEVSLVGQPDDWALPSNGCNEPIATLATTAVTFESQVTPAVVTSIICAPGAAFAEIGSVLLQPGPADGGGVLLLETESGWTSSGPGASYPCDDAGDGVDLCDLFGVDGELSSALLPVPSPDTTGPTDATPGPTDRTAEVQAWLGGELDPAVIDSIVVDRLVDPDAEVPAVVRREDRVGDGDLNLLVIEIPQLDDAFLTETWAVWIGAVENPGVRAWSWARCARGVTEDGLCV